MCGCGEKTNIAKSTDASVGAVAGSPLKYVLGHNRRKSPTAYRVDAATGCWVWQRATTKSGGYGQIRVGGRIQMAHRYYYEKHVGPIPAGLHIDHLCKNTVCVNPSHLEPVTQAENNRRSRL